MKNIQIVKEEEQVIALEVNGEIDIYNVKEFKETIEKITYFKKNIIIDMKNLEFIDSSGLGVLVTLAQELNKDKRAMELLNPPAHIVKLISTTGIDNVIKVTIDNSLFIEKTKNRLDYFCDDQLSITMPAKPAYVGIARLAVAAVASRYDFNIEAIEDIKIAVTEILTNAISHNEPSLEKVSLKTIFDCENHLLRIDISDEGVGFNQEILKQADMVETKAGGLGIFIVGSLMDKVEILTSKGNGTYIKMYKYGDN